MERSWYVAVGGRDRQGPMSERELRERICKGELQAADLVWAEGMASWAPLSSVPELQPAPHQADAPAHEPAPEPQPVVTAAPAAAPEAKPAAPAPASSKFGSWLSLVGVMNIIGGGLMCLGCVGIPIGVLMIMAGSAALSARTALASVGETDPATAALLSKLHAYFRLTGWAFIVYLAMILVVLAIYGIIIAAIASGFRGSMP